MKIPEPDPKFKNTRTGSTPLYRNIRKSEISDPNPNAHPYKNTCMRKGKNVNTYAKCSSFYFVIFNCNSRRENPLKGQVAWLLHHVDVSTWQMKQIFLLFLMKQIFLISFKCENRCAFGSCIFLHHSMLFRL